MGLIQHNAVIATTWDAKKLAAVQLWISGLDPKWAAQFVTAGVVANDGGTVAMLPDGSKEGWGDSDEGDRLRERFIERLKEDDYDDGSSPWDVVDISFGECGTRIEYTNCLPDIEDEGEEADREHQDIRP